MLTCRRCDLPTLLPKSRRPRYGYHFGSRSACSQRARLKMMFLFSQSSCISPQSNKSEKGPVIRRIHGKILKAPNSLGTARVLWESVERHEITIGFTDKDCYSILRHSARYYIAEYSNPEASIKRFPRIGRLERAQCALPFHSRELST